MAKAELPSPELLRKLLDYNPETGALTWLPRGPELFPPSIKGAVGASRCWNAKYAGKSPGSLDSSGYLWFRVLGKCLKAHRVIWAIHYGEWPAHYLDHINHDRTDNRIVNLRAATCQENSRNRRTSARSKSGAMGVYCDPMSGRWRAVICGPRDGVRKNIHLGTFANKSDAIEARLIAARQFGYHPNHGQ